MFKTVLFVLFAAFVGIESITKFDISPCKREKESTCLTKISNIIYNAAIVGDPSSDIESLDPVEQDFIEGDLASIKYKLSKTHIVGYKQCVIQKTTLVDDLSEQTFDLYCPRITMKGDYETNGKLISLPIEGKGYYTLEAKDYYISFVSKTKITKADDGKEYLAYKNFKVNGDLRGGMEFYMDNLFNGQKELADTFNRFVKENWKEVADLVQAPILNTMVKRIVKNLNKVLKSVPLDMMLSME